MTQDNKDILKVLLILTLITLAIILIGYFFSIHFLLVIGTLGICALIFSLISLGRISDYLGCGYLIIVGALGLFCICLLFGDFKERGYIVYSSNKFHKYEDCEAIETCNIKSVSQLEGFYHFIFKECEICNARKKKENREKRILEEQEEREEMIDYLEGLIWSLENGESVSNIIDKIQDDFSE